MRKDHAKRKRIYWITIMTPVCIAVLFAILYPLLFGKNYQNPSFYPAAGSRIPETDRIMTVWFFDVGQADASLVKTPDGKYLLFDAASDENEVWLSAALHSIGVRSIDAIFLSHSHEDHIGGADRILSDFSVGNVIVNRYPEDSVSAEKLLRSVEAEGIPLSIPANGEVFFFDDVTVTVMLPEENAADNNTSALFRVAFDNVSILYTGDAEKETESYIMNSFLPYLDSDILKVGHHGSSSSTSLSFLKAVSPEYAVISCGAANEYAHPDQIVLDRLISQKCTVARTDLSGTVIFRTDGNTIF